MSTYKVTVKQQQKTNTSLSETFGVEPANIQFIEYEAETITGVYFGAGIPKSEEHKARIGDAHRGKVYSDETRAKISAARKGKPLSEEHKAKIVRTGKKHTAETKAKISAARRARKNQLVSI